MAKQRNWQPSANIVSMRTVLSAAWRDHEIAILVQIPAAHEIVRLSSQGHPSC
jgi:hypothetical protein